MKKSIALAAQRKKYVSTIALLFISGLLIGQYHSFDTFFSEDSTIVDSIYSYSWDTDINDWVLSCFNGFHGGHELGARTVFSYDKNACVTMFIENHWYNEEWDDPLKVAYHYDEDGNQIVMLISHWSSTINDYKRRDSVSSTYDINGNKTSTVRYYWNTESSNWLKGLKYWWRDMEYSWEDSAAYTYDEMSNRTKTVLYRWNAANNDWDYWNKYEYEYGENGGLVSETGCYWDTTSNDWFFRNKQEYEYHESGYQSSKLYFDWDRKNNDWSIRNKYDYKHDEHGNLLSSVFFDCDELSNDWIVQYKKEYVYDERGNKTKTINSRWDTINSIWNESGRQKLEYYYSEFNQSTVTNTYFNTAKFANIYPNPGNSFFNIETEQSGHFVIEITSLGGQLIFSNAMEGNMQQIDLSPYSNGIYLLTVRSKEHVQTMKIIKQ